MTAAEEHELAQLKREHADAASRDYAELVMAVADGERVSSAEGEAILLRAGVSAEQFGKDARTLLDLRSQPNMSAARFDCESESLRQQQLEAICDPS